MAETAAERASRPTPSPALRVGVVLDSHRPAAWIHRLLVEIQESTHSGLEAVVVVQTPARQRAGGSAGRLLGLVERLDARLLAAQPDALARWDLRAAQPGLRFESFAAAADAERQLAGLELDVVLALDSRCGGLERCAAHGAWSVGFGDPPGARGSSALLLGASRSQLGRRRGHSGGRALGESHPLSRNVVLRSGLAAA